ncbi:MAG: tetratricopeptide repeat protein [Sarcina sp.]
MDISNKKLRKAYSLYESGNLNEALALCEKFLQKDSCNPEALELEGKILRDLGRLEEAIITWKINSEYNDNEDAKYNLDQIDDDKKEHTLNYENLNILLSEAGEENKSSSFLPDITFKKDSFENVKIEEPQEEVIDSEVNIDNSTISTESSEPITNEPEAIEHEVEVHNPQFEVNFNEDNFAEEKEIKEPAKVEPTTEKAEFIPEKENKNSSKPVEEFVPEKITSRTESHKPKSKKLLYTIVGFVIALIIVIIAVCVSTSSKNKTEASKPQVEAPKVPTTSPVTPTPEATAPKVLSDSAAEALMNQLTTLVEANSYDGVNKLLTENPVNTIPEKYVADYNKAVSFMETQGVNYYYEQEMSAYNNKDYQDAINYFNQAKPYYKNFEAAPSMLFTEASSYEGLNQPEKAAEIYKEYLTDFPNSQYYTQECLYNLAIYYSKAGNSTEAKSYANQLVTNYSSSMYNNSNIQDILNK